ncbi:TlpA family protein disulfide reductase [Mangrovibacterium lignilyticum]|uniref:TlpA family protein disulfide reductase n=1 Tax=Mangrovibacterium lignilyticum TaxID=2668052 RepID=UPI001967E2CA|nr:TlpA disulfide reductase family protein [Mangrovibacterium lignilyticum]
MKAWFLLFLVAFNFLTINLKAQEGSDSSTLVAVSQQCPDFSFIDENGATHQLQDLRGKVVLVNFFATWCGPCMQELPHVQKEIFDKYSNNPNFVLLTIGREHSQQEMKAFKDKKAFNFNIIADPKREIYSKFATQFIPRNFLIDANGEIIYSSIGFDENEFAKLKETIEDQLN